MYYQLATGAQIFYVFIRKIIFQSFNRMQSIQYPCNLYLIF